MSFHLKKKKVDKKNNESVVLQPLKQHHHKRSHSSVLFPDLSQLKSHTFDVRTKRRLKTYVYQPFTEDITQNDFVIEENQGNTQKVNHYSMTLKRKAQHCSLNQLKGSFKGRICDGILVFGKKPQEDSFFIFISKEIINSCRLMNESPIQSLNRAFKAIQEMERYLYSYQSIEKQLKLLNLIVFQLKSRILSFKTFVFSAKIAFQYYSYSESIFYFSKAFKYINEKHPLKFKQEKQLVLVIYKTVARMLLKNGFRDDAREFAYTYLRKLWKMQYYEQELSAYDFLGEIQNQMSNPELSKYFHQKMCSGETEKNEIVRLSNIAFKKSQKERLAINSFENISEFVQYQRQFNTFLRSHYMAEVKSQYIQGENGMKVVKKRIPKIVLTHKSPNRVTQNSHQLQRQIMRGKSSKELRFVTGKSVKRLKMAIRQYEDFLISIKLTVVFTENVNRYSLPGF